MHQARSHERKHSKAAVILQNFVNELDPCHSAGNLELIWTKFLRCQLLYL